MCRMAGRSEETQLKTKGTYRFAPLTITEAATILSTPANGAPVWAGDVQYEWTERLQAWADSGELEVYPDGTTCLFNVAQCLTHGAGNISPDVKNLADQFYTVLETLMRGKTSESAVKQVDDLMERIKRSNDVIRARAIIENTLGTIRTSAPDDKQATVMKTRGYVPGDLSNMVVRVDRAEDIRRGLEHIEQHPRKYHFARWVLLEGPHGLKLFTIWCLEYGYHPDTGEKYPCTLLTDRLPFLRACGVVNEGMENELNVAKMLYKIHRKTASRLVREAVNDSLKSKEWRRDFWGIEGDTTQRDSDGDAIATVYRRRQLQRLMPTLPRLPLTNRSESGAVVDTLTTTDSSYTMKT